MDPAGYKLLLVGEKGTEGHVKDIENFMEKSFSGLTKQVRELRHKSHFEEQERRKLEKGQQEKLRDIKGAKDILEPPSEKRRYDRRRRRYSVED